MDNVQEKSNYCEGKTKELIHSVSLLQSKEDRNDGFMEDLLKKVEALDVSKLESEVYFNDKERIWNKFRADEKISQENHIHYVQIENYLEKYMPLKIQKAVGKTLVAMF